MRGGAAVLAALLVGAAAVWLFWPGVAMYDSIAQYGEVLGGAYDDWHPPAMARLWALLHGAFGGGAAPMLVVQVALYATGFGLFAGALAGTGRGRAAVAAIVLAASPLLLGWQVVVLKDAQMVGALLAGVGIVAAYRLRGRRVPIPAAGLVIVLLAYATLVRSNALFATVPLAVLFLPAPRAMPARLGLIVASTLAVLVATPFINHRLLGATATSVANSQPLFDLAGIAVRTPPQPGDFFSLDERARIIERGCAKPFFWDPLGDEHACGPVLERAQDLPTATLWRALGSAILAHPLAYARQRLAHWVTTEGWLVPPGLIAAAPPSASEPNSVGLRSPAHPLAARWQQLAAAEVASPLGWPIVWAAVALFATLTAYPLRGTPAGSLALALAGSAVALEASFAVVSIASDLRYHLWPMAAGALALILLLDGTPPRRWRLGALALGAIVVSGVVARASLPTPPSSYRAMIDTPGA